MDSIERFIRYAKIDTQADENSTSTPSTERQKDLGFLLLEELKELGLTDAHMDKYGNVYAHLSGEGSTCVGFNAHMDTALEVTDTFVNPRYIHNYNGSDISLNLIHTLSINEFPSLAKHIGHDLIVTDGDTLLGADDKAGIAIIMSALEYLKNNPDIKHHNIAVCFTCDEEIGRGPDHFDIKKMNADFAYTIDGSDIDSIDYENFNAASADIEITGVSVHPGEGKNALINALLIANEIINELPSDQTPFYANEDQGFYHITSIEGSSASCKLSMIIRDFDKAKLEAKISLLNNIIDGLSAKYSKTFIGCSIDYQYENMKEYVDKNPKAVEVAMAALRKNGLTPKSTKIRGGTDGATFSKMGLITPNLGTGSYNHHGRYEYLDIQEFEKMISIVVDIMRV